MLEEETNNLVILPGAICQAVIAYQTWAVPTSLLFSFPAVATLPMLWFKPIISETLDAFYPCFHGPSSRLTTIIRATPPRLHLHHHHEPQMQACPITTAITIPRVQLHLQLCKTAAARLTSSRPLPPFPLGHRRYGARASDPSTLPIPSVLAQGAEARKFLQAPLRQKNPQTLFPHRRQSGFWLNPLKIVKFRLKDGPLWRRYPVDGGAEKCPSFSSFSAEDRHLDQDILARLDDSTKRLQKSYYLL